MFSTIKNRSDDPCGPLCGTLVASSLCSVGEASDEDGQRGVDNRPMDAHDQLE